MDESVRNKPILFLDGLRGLAALYVMIGHARWLLWEGYTEGYQRHPELYGQLAKLVMYFFTLFRYGHEAVYFFFVLSGFVIHLKYARQFKNGNLNSFRFWEYLGRRAKRLYPPLLFAMLLTLVLDTWGRSKGFGIYSGNTVYPIINGSINSDLGWQTFLGNILFLQRVAVPVYGSDGPLWSLMYEWWFYMIYPLFLLLNKRSVGAALVLVTILAIAAGALPQIPLVSAIFQYFLSWWIGVLLADIYSKRLIMNSMLPAWLTLILPAMFVFNGKIMNSLLSDTIWAVGFGGLVYGLLKFTERGKRFIFLESLQWLGNCSYSLYVIHFPFFVLFSGMLMNANRGLLPVSQWFIVSGIAFALAIAYVVHLFVERPFVRTKSRKIENPTLSNLKSVN